MNLATRKAIYQVVTINNGERWESPFFKDEGTAKHMYNKFVGHNQVTLFCWTKPTVTKGQIDADLY